MNKIITNPSVMPQKDAEQLISALRAFKSGEKQPEGRFIIIGSLEKEEVQANIARMNGFFQEFQEGHQEYELDECQRCGGSGFSGLGTGYDDVCDDCGGQGEIIVGIKAKGTESTESA